MRFPRASGILLHITCLPDFSGNGFGIGDLGPSALQFVEFLEAAGQRTWQILPLCPTGKGNSPYSSYSAFAGNLLVISPEAMVSDGWLKELGELPSALSEPSRVQFQSTREYKQGIFESAFASSREKLKSDVAYQAFCQENAWWLDEFARFDAMMKHFDESNWTLWPKEIARREDKALTTMDSQLAEEIECAKFLQFVFDVQWNRVKKHANQRNVRIYGDMPIFVAHESVDVWANQSLFLLNSDGMPTHVAGVPPDYFSKTGQLWGNPLYRWDVMEENNFSWWTKRFQRGLQQFDLLRVDHFRGFESYWEIPAGSETAVSGSWQSGPKEKPFVAAQKAHGELPIIAEDLGDITQEVHELRERLGFPPMRVLQFGFSSEEDSFHRPDSFPEHCVAYTGTHDNDTVIGWYRENETNQTEAYQLLNRFLSGESEVHVNLIEMLFHSRADTVIVPMQDLLGLGNEARMNVPGVASGNWEWRLNPCVLSSKMASDLIELTQSSGRANHSSAG